jgi:hypothetical protein
MPVYCECSVLSGRGLCFGLITRPDVSECDHEASTTRRPRATRAVKPLGVGGGGGNRVSVLNILN